MHRMVGWPSNGSCQAVLLFQHQVKTGFGTGVIRELIPFDLGGTVALAFASDGLQCQLEIPADWLSCDAQIGDASRGFDLEQAVYRN